MLLSSEQFLTYRAKVKKYLGFSDKEIDEVLDPQPMIEDNDDREWLAWKERQEKRQQMASRPELVEYELHIVPYNCTIDPDSELHWKIKDTIDWLMIKALSNQPAVLDNLFRDSIAMRQSTDVVKTIKELLEQELLTNVIDLKINSYKTYETFTDVLKIGVAITLQQSYINNYQDFVEQQMIEKAIKAIQSKREETTEEVQSQVYASSDILKQHALLSKMSAQFNGRAPIVGEIRWDPLTMQNQYFDGTVWRYSKMYNHPIMS